MLVTFPSPLLKGSLVRRYKRFLADIELESGDIVTAHCCNPGAMLGLDRKGATVWLSETSNPARKLRYSWELVQVDLGEGPVMVGINTSHPNQAAAVAIAGGHVPELFGYEEMKREVRYGKNSRIDLQLSAQGRRDCYVEVKNVHLMRQPGLAEFPDSVTTRGAKHLRELSEIARSGMRAVMLFLIQRGDAQRFRLAADIDPAYAEAFRLARRAGVEALPLVCDLSPAGLSKPRRIPLLDVESREMRSPDIAPGHISP